MIEVLLHKTYNIKDSDIFGAIIQYCIDSKSPNKLLQAGGEHLWKSKDYYKHREAVLFPVTVALCPIWKTHMRRNFRKKYIVPYNYNYQVDNQYLLFGIRKDVVDIYNLIQQTPYTDFIFSEYGLARQLAKVDCQPESFIMKCNL